MANPVALGPIAFCSFIVISDVDDAVALRHSKARSLLSFRTGFVELVSSLSPFWRSVRRVCVSSQ